MSWWWYLVALCVVIAASAIVGIFTGMMIDEKGSDDRDDSKPADLWAGYERRKCKPYE